MGVASLVAVGAAAVVFWSGHASALLMHQAPEENVSATLETQAQLEGGCLEPRCDISKALQCLRLTTPGLELRYPVDAEQHAEEIMEALRPFNKGFVGTYGIEDVWSTVVADSWFNRTDKSARLSQFFGPYVPIFAEFLKPWRLNIPYLYRYPVGFVQTLRRVLRKDVPYVAVSQNAEGIMGLAGQFRMSDFPSILVLSAGGYGHVAVPLMRPTPTNGRTPLEAKQLLDQGLEKQADRGPVRRRKYLVSYVGSLEHSPHNLREEMKRVVEDFAKSQYLHGRKVGFFYWAGAEPETWEPVMFNSRFSLVPRGYGRSAFHLVETIRRGLVPVYVYTDRPWLPYPELYKTFGYSTNISGLPSLLKKLNAMTDSEIEARESAAAAAARSHFTLEAVMGQIKAFLLGGATDLVCQELPESVTDMGKTNFRGDAA